jgi:2-haloacid dehalogenase
MGEPKPTTVIFDLGGVLIDWNPRHLYRKLFAEEAAMEAFLAEVCTNAWNTEQDRGRSFAAAVEELVARHPEQRHLIEAYHRRWIEMIGGPMAGTVAILDRLAGREVPLFALTNWSAETFLLVRDDPAFAFLDRFERVFVSGELRLIKPDPAIYRHVLEASGRRAAECLFIDDSAVNVDAAREVGLHTHLFRTPEALCDELRGFALLD